jgi:long-chain acyl-CoA synthetase
MNDIGFPCSFLACMLGGFVAAPVNPELGAENVEFILDLVRPALVVDTPPAIEEGGSTSSDFDVVADLDACGAIFFTSGTTGRPKGVRHRWSALVGNVAAFNDAMALGSGTRMYHVLPMAYMAGFLNTVLSPMVAGGTVIIGPRFSASSALEFWTRPVRERANTIWVTPSIAAALTRLVRDRTAARVSATSFETVFCGTAPLHPSVRHQFNEVFGIKLQESYGTSELLLVSAQTRRQAERMTEDVGEPLPELALAFRRDAEGRDELIIRSPFAMIDYLTENGLETIADAEGFVPTGDMGRLDRGILQITGRIKDLIIRGGVNIVPRTVEDVVRDVAGVEDVAVVGMPHEFWGEALVVCIQVNPEAVAEQVEIAVRQRCRERLARSHQPDRIVMMPTFPRAATGKVQKHLVKRSLEE